LRAGAGARCDARPARLGGRGCGAQARAEAAAELGGVAGAGPKLLHFVRSTPLVAATLVGHKQTVRRPAGRHPPFTCSPCRGR